jgi:iron complex outermembrane receptor protein
MKGQHAIQYIETSLGYGEVGNQDFPSGASLDRIEFGQQSISQPYIGNPDLKWEASKTTNVGLTSVFSATV